MHHFEGTMHFFPLSIVISCFFKGDEKEKKKEEKEAEMAKLKNLKENQKLEKDQKEDDVKNNKERGKNTKMPVYYQD